ncbi:MAG: hypothetical protein LBS85_04475 [Clostridiales Family XIII bacterium]|jgi:hypothetical protein|nr:hypothetical protein [Clostridiales Family XIII bacterium]
MPMFRLSFSPPRQLAIFSANMNYLTEPRCVQIAPKTLRPLKLKTRKYGIYIIIHLCFNMYIIIYTLNPDDINTAVYESLSANLYAVRAEWRRLMPTERHRAVIEYYSRKMKGNCPVFSNISGAVMRDIPVPPRISYRPHCYSTAKRHLGKNLIRWHFSTAYLDFDLIGGARVAKPERVVVDLASSLDAKAALTALNHCIAAGHFSAAALAKSLCKNSGIPGNKKLSLLLPFANAKCESPMETLAWLTIYQAGLVMPEQQVTLSDADRFLGRVDMRWQIDKRSNRRSIVAELDGKIKYTDKEAIFSEKKREDRITEAGHKVLRFTWADIQSGKMISRLKDIGIPERRNFGRKFPRWDSDPEINSLD